MNRFIGLDSHSKSCTFVVLDDKGQVKNKAVVETNGTALINFVKTIPGMRQLCVEEGTQSQWLHDILSPHVEDLAIVLGRKNPGNKDDYGDAFRLANRMRTGDLGHRIWKVGSSLSALKHLVRSYEMVNGDLVRVKNRINFYYRSLGVPVQSSGCPGCGKPAGCRQPGLHHAVERLRKEQEHLETLKLEAQKDMVCEAQRHPPYRILQTAPGIGPVRAAELLVIVITPHRFRTSRQFWTYCGLSIVQRSSADWVKAPDDRWIRASVVQTRGLNRNFNRLAKSIFKGAAMTVITTTTPDHPLRADYNRLVTNGTKPNLARLTLARKIAALVLSMWKKQEVYDPARHRLKPD